MSSNYASFVTVWPSHCTINLCHWSQELLWISTCSSLLLVVPYATWWCHLFGKKVMWKMYEFIAFSTLVMHYDSVYYPFFIFLFPGFVYYVSCLHVGCWRFVLVNFAITSLSQQIVNRAIQMCLWVCACHFMLLLLHCIGADEFSL